MPQYRLGSLLIQKGLIDQDQLDEALVLQQQNTGQPIGEALVTLGHVTHKQITKALCKQTCVRTWAAWAAFVMAPFNLCHAADDIENLPEYEFTQVHDQHYFDGDDHGEFASHAQPATLDLLQVTSSAMWHLYKSDASLDAMKDMPVKLNISKLSNNNVELQLSIKF